jgi:hypothetical protein
MGARLTGWSRSGNIIALDHSGRDMVLPSGGNVRTRPHPLVQHDGRIEVDPALDALRDRLAEIIASPPDNTEDLVDTLSGLAKLSNQWSEAIQALRAPTRRLVGPAAAASVSVAARRAEESFIELEITLGDALAAQPRAVRHP